jgi:hypothetical protein
MGIPFAATVCCEYVRDDRHLGPRATAYAACRSMPTSAGRSGGAAVAGAD